MLSPDQERTYSSREELRLFNLIEQPVWVFDIIKKEMWFANSAAMELWNAESLEELLSRDFMNDMSEATARRLDEYLIKFKRGERLRDQWTFYPNGQGPKTVETVALGIHIEEGRMAMLLQGVCRDISLETEKLGLRAVEMIRHLPVAVCQFDMEGNVMEQNPEALATFGTVQKYNHSNPVGMNSPPLDDISESSDESTVTDIDEDDEDVFIEPVCQFVNRFVDQDVGRNVLENVQNGKDCSLEAEQHTVQGPRWSSIRVRKTKDPVTSKPVILYSSRDITQVVDAKKQAEKAKMDKSDFFAMMAHEVRTPLHHVVSVIDLVSKGKLSKAESKFRALLDSSAKLLMTVINDMFASVDNSRERIKLEYTTFNLDDVVSCVMNLVAPKARQKGLQVQVHMSARLGKLPFVGDQNRLRQILFNLLQNAVKFTHSGSIELSVKRHSKSRSNRTLLRFEVKDTGIGISLQQRERLFENQPLSRLDKDKGVGLAICKASVDSMGGRIGVQSHAERGSLFWFEVPFRRSTSRSHLDDSMTTLDPVPDEGGLRILLVDDDDTNCKIMTAMLEKFGNTVCLCRDGKQMIHAIQHDSSFDVVLLEMDLPGMSGLEATRRIRSMGYTRETLPIIALTTSPPRVDFVDAGLNDWLTKPILMKDIKAAMTNAICNCGNSVGASTVFTGDSTFAKRSVTESVSDNLVSLMTSVIVDKSISES